MLIHDAILDFGDVCLSVYWRFYLQKGASGDTDHGDLAALTTICCGCNGMMIAESTCYREKHACSCVCACACVCVCADGLIQKLNVDCFGSV